ncbi:hypothetical protein Xen7305DRAFT_00036700 [Xenococcus sp. PCC 7305]|uniref:hypothetical protein n=1 Tax=Xenococcus sp. PCC 7305 TaxID=102125 RepID=UPI0002AC55FE|nr:hypothetical protein [Xenococcus sp. PCC 7305]ELS03946.1 hypothetical protein Xen7305DRAFT_00036700 [Xenococcus sp. PCC 7305]
MNVENAIEPDSQTAALEFLKKLAPDESFVMVNLLKFKENAEYKEGSKYKEEKAISGAEAYQKYLDEVIGFVQKSGKDVQVLSDSKVFGLLLGKVEELWDRVVLVRYGSVKVFQELTQSKPFLDAQEHRLAGLAGQLNIGTKASS